MERVKIRELRNVGYQGPWCRELQDIIIISRHGDRSVRYFGVASPNSASTVHTPTQSPMYLTELGFLSSQIPRRQDGASSVIPWTGTRRPYSVHRA